MTVNHSSLLCNRPPNQIIAYSAGGAVTVDRFVADATALAGALPDQQYVINLLTDRYQYLLGFCASVIAGQCTLMPPNRQVQILENLLRDYPDCYTLGDGGKIACKSVLPDSISDTASAGDRFSPPEISANQLCAIAFTSGSTGTPKPNLKYWETVHAGSISNANLLLEENAGATNLVATVPSQHMWGFEMSILLPLFANVAVSHRTPFYPQDIADAIAVLPENRALVSSPTHLDALLKSNIRTIELDWIFSATAPLSVELATGLEQAFGAQVRDVFGCSESGIIAVRNACDETLWRLASAFKLEITKDEVLIRAQHLPEDVAMSDVIELTGENTFRCIGRRQDMINIAGKRGSLADLNHRLVSIPGVSDGVVFMPEAESKRLAAMVVASDLAPSDILSALKSQIDPVFLPRPVYIVSDLPRQATGKLTQKAVIDLFNEIGRKKSGNEKIE